MESLNKEYHREGVTRATVNRWSELPARKSALRRVYFQSPLIKSSLTLFLPGRNNYATGSDKAGEPCCTRPNLISIHGVYGWNSRLEQ